MNFTNVKCSANIKWMQIQPSIYTSLVYCNVYEKCEIDVAGCEQQFLHYSALITKDQLISE